MYYKTIFLYLTTVAILGTGVFASYKMHIKTNKKIDALEESMKGVRLDFNKLSDSLNTLQKSVDYVAVILGIDTSKVDTSNTLQEKLEK